MKNPETPADPIPLHDYGPALQNAVSWLGDRYLLAEPARRREEARKAYFSQPKNWYGARRAGVQTRH